jgi:hypothetical protein
LVQRDNWTPTLSGLVLLTPVPIVMVVGVLGVGFSVFDNQFTVDSQGKLWNVLRTVDEFHCDSGTGVPPAVGVNAIGIHWIVIPLGVFVREISDHARVPVIFDDLGMVDPVRSETVSVHHSDLFVSFHPPVSVFGSDTVESTVKLILVPVTWPLPDALRVETQCPVPPHPPVPVVPIDLSDHPSVAQENPGSRGPAGVPMAPDCGVPGPSLMFEHVPVGSAHPTPIIFSPS